MRTDNIGHWLKKLVGKFGCIDYFHNFADDRGLRHFDK